MKISMTKNSLTDESKNIILTSEVHLRWDGWIFDKELLQEKNPNGTYLGILIGSVYKYDRNYYTQVVLEECKDLVRIKQ